MTGPVEVAARLLAERTGMQITPGLQERLAACLDGAARAGEQTAAGYAAGLAADPGAFQRLLDCVTVQESGFFRHPDQFAALAAEVLPALEGPVAVWSAGCGNGQEAYSLAMGARRLRPPRLAGAGHRHLGRGRGPGPAVRHRRAGRHPAGAPPLAPPGRRPVGGRPGPARPGPGRAGQPDRRVPGRAGPLPGRVLPQRAHLSVQSGRRVVPHPPGRLAGPRWAGVPRLRRDGPAPDPGPAAPPGRRRARAAGRGGGRVRGSGAAQDTGGSGGLGTTALPFPAAGLPSQKGPPLGRVGFRRAQRPAGDAQPPSGFAAAGGAATTTVVAFRSGGQHWAVAVERVQRVLAARGLLPLPDPRPGVAGLLHRDGDTVPVLSALGGGQFGQVLVLDDRGRSVGLLVDEVIGIEHVGGRPGPVPAGQRSPLVAGVLPGADPRLLLDVTALTGWLAP